MTNAIELRDDIELMGTPEVADEADVSEDEARAWAQDNGVQRVGGNGFVWTSEDVDDFLNDLDEAELEGDDDAE
jgi:hypothetical protein